MNYQRALDLNRMAEMIRVDQGSRLVLLSRAIPSWKPQGVQWSYTGE